MNFSLAKGQQTERTGRSVPSVDRATFHCRSTHAPRTAVARSSPQQPRANCQSSRQDALSLVDAIQLASTHLCPGHMRAQIHPFLRGESSQDLANSPGMIDVCFTQEQARLRPADARAQLDGHDCLVVTVGGCPSGEVRQTRMGPQPVLLGFRTTMRHGLQAEKKVLVSNFGNTAP